MEALILTLLDRFPSAIVEGHRDMPGAATQCPGFNAREWWSQVTARRVAEMKAPKPAPLPIEAEKVIADADKTALSKTNWAGVATAGVGAWQGFNVSDWRVQLAALAVVAFAVFIIFERNRKSKLAKDAKKALGL